MSPPRSCHVSSKALKVAELPGKVKRFAVSLQENQQPLVDFLAGGGGYDNDSVAGLVQQGNRHFDHRQLDEAVTVYMVAYEIGRMTFDYKPLMHDLLVRRALCHSMLGDFKRALEECDMALNIIPNEATVFIIKALLYCKMHSCDLANTAFQKAAILRREFRDLVDCFVATLALQQTQWERAIDICSQVLRRSPRYPFALLMRGSSYKWHPSGYYSRKAADDFVSLLEIDMIYQPFLGRRHSPENHKDLDELLLLFHPTLQNQGPRPYVEYPLYRRNNTLRIAALVTVAAAKLLRASRSSRLELSVRSAYDQLLEHRSELERQVRRLVEQQQRLGTADVGGHEVSGPSEAESREVRQYRRFWTEQMQNPQPLAETSAVSLVETVSPIPAALRSSMREMATMASGAQAKSEPWSSTSAAMTVALPSVTMASKDSQSLQQSPSGQQFLQEPARRLPPAPPAPPMAPLAAAPLASEAKPIAAVNAVRLAAEEAAWRPAAEDVSATFQRTGEGWTEADWLDKALQIVDLFAMKRDINDPAESIRPYVSQASSGRPPLVPSPQGRAGVMQQTGLQGEYLELDIVEAIEKYGFDVLPDWFPALDRIYEVQDMAVFQVWPEQPSAISGLVGAPGHSYVVPKSPRRSQNSAGKTEGSQPRCPTPTESSAPAPPALTPES